ncbi:MAG: hypothetical protein FJZ01_15025 [Candidatus Sericytochromatia bacterium]|nr:hypothetical protein [Candidatus Tanganyikabacteria bacterium]
MEAVSEQERGDEGLPRSLKPGHWLARPLRHAKTGAMLLPAGTIFNQDVIEKVRSMDVELDALLCLGPGKKPVQKTQAEIAEHYTRQRTTIERIAEAFGNMRDVSFGLFCMSAVFAFAFSSGVFAVLAGCMLAAMLLNAWLSIAVLHKLSTLNRMFAGMSVSRAKAS